MFGLNIFEWIVILGFVFVWFELRSIAEILNRRIGGKLFDIAYMLGGADPSVYGSDTNYPKFAIDREIRENERKAREEHLKQLERKERTVVPPPSRNLSLGNDCPEYMFGVQLDEWNKLGQEQQKQVKEKYERNQQEKQRMMREGGSWTHCPYCKLAFGKSVPLIRGNGACGCLECGFHSKEKSLQ